MSADDERREDEQQQGTPEAGEDQATPAADAGAGPEAAGEPEAGPTSEPAAEADPPVEEPPAEEPAREEPPAEEPTPDEAEQPAPAPPAAERQRADKRAKKAAAAEEVVPGADLEPDLVLEERREDEPLDEQDLSRYVAPGTSGDEAAPEPAGEAEDSPEREQEPAPIKPVKLAADARYQATGKRKTAVARVVLKPGSGSYTINGAPLERAFPRRTLQETAREALAATGNDSRMDVAARIHGGGVAAQAAALRHGIARALVEADPHLRGELKRRGFLTRDPRVKERKKAGLKKARKRPQFSKR